MTALRFQEDEIHSSKLDADMMTNANAIKKLLLLNDLERRRRGITLSSKGDDLMGDDGAVSAALLLTLNLRILLYESISMTCK